MTLFEGLVEDLFDDIADVTLIDEDTKPVDLINYVELKSQHSHILLSAMYFMVDRLFGFGLCNPCWQK